MSEPEPPQPLSQVLRSWVADEYGTDPATDGDPVELFYDDLAGIAEVAENLGVPRKRVERWIERRESTRCPAPVRELKMGNVYSIASWRGWHRLWVLTRGAETWRVNRNE